MLMAWNFLVKTREGKGCVYFYHMFEIMHIYIYTFALLSFLQEEPGFNAKLIHNCEFAFTVMKLRLEELLRCIWAQREKLCFY